MSLTNDDIRRMEQRPMVFLTLAPTTSESYPTSQSTQTVAPTGIARRSSSQSGDKLRFLKLGPVHWGEHPDEHKEDFHEVAVE